MHKGLQDSGGCVCCRTMPSASNSARPIQRASVHICCQAASDVMHSSSAPKSALRGTTSASHLYTPVQARVRRGAFCSSTCMTIRALLQRQAYSLFAPVQATVRSGPRCSSSCINISASAIEPPDIPYITYESLEGVSPASISNDESLRGWKPTQPPYLCLLTQRHRGKGRMRGRKERR